MKLFDFQCDNCEEVLCDVDVSETDVLTLKCPKCGCVVLSRLMGGAKCQHSSWSRWRVSNGPSHCS